MEPLRALHEWATKYRPAMLAARERFEQAQRAAAGKPRFTTPK